MSPLLSTDPCTRFPAYSQVARNTKIINADSEDAKYVINIKQMAKYVVALGEKVSPTDIEEGMRVGVDRNKYQIQVQRVE